MVSTKWSPAVGQLGRLEKTSARSEHLRLLVFMVDM
jgi:hypothetical protein